MSTSSVLVQGPSAVAEKLPVAALDESEIVSGSAAFSATPAVCSWTEIGADAVPAGSVAAGVVKPIVGCDRGSSVVQVSTYAALSAGGGHQAVSPGPPGAWTESCICAAGRSI